MANDIKINIGAKDAASGVLAKVGANVGKLGASVSKVGLGVSKVGAGIAAGATAALAPLAAAVVSFGQAGNELDKMSKRTGVAVEGLSELAFVTEQTTEVGLDVLEKGLKGMQRSMFDASRGSAEIVDSLAAVGLTSADLEGKLPVDAFTLLAGRIGELEDPNLKAAVAMKLFGKSGAELVPLMNEGVDGIQKLRDEARELGRSMSTEDAASAAEYTDAMNRVSSVVVGLKNQIGAALAPAITDITNRIAASTKGIATWIANNRQLVVGFAMVTAGVLAFGVTIAGLGGVIAAAGFAISGLGALITGVGAMISAVLSPVGLVIAGVTSVVAGLAAVLITLAVQTGLMSVAFEQARNILSNFWAVAKSTFEGISNALAANDWKLAVEIGWAGIKVAFWTGLQDISIAVSVMMPKMWLVIKQFFTKFVTSAIKATNTVASILANPGKAGVLAAGFFKSLEFGDVGGGLTKFVVGNRMKAEKELLALKETAKAAAAEAKASTAAIDTNMKSPELPKLPEMVAPDMTAIVAQAKAAAEEFAKAAGTAPADMMSGLKDKIEAMRQKGADIVTPQIPIAVEAAVSVAKPEGQPLQAAESRLLSGRTGSVDKTLEETKRLTHGQREQIKLQQRLVRHAEREQNDGRANVTMRFVG